MPHRVVHPLLDGVSVRKGKEGVCEEIRVMMSVLDGLFLQMQMQMPVFGVFWVLMVG